MIQGLSKISEIATVRRLSSDDVEQIYALSLGNPLFYEYCPPAVTLESIRADMAALPPGKTMKDKYYMGFFVKDTLAAVLDLIVGYPADKTAWIGLFMMHPDFQGQGLGSRIIGALLEDLRHSGFDRVRLAYASGNPQSEAFWLKNGFEKTGQISDQGDYQAVLMEKRLPPKEVTL